MGSGSSPKHLLKTSVTSYRAKDNIIRFSCLGLQDDSMKVSEIRNSPCSPIICGC